MGEYRFSKKYFMFSWLSIIIIIALMIILDSALYLTILFALLVVGIYSSVKDYNIRYVVDNNCIVKKTFKRRQEILKLDEINKIVILINVKNGVGFFGKEKKFIVSPTLGNYKEMIKIIIEKSKGNKEIYIDPKVLEKINWDLTIYAFTES